MGKLRQHTPQVTVASEKFESSFIPGAWASFFKCVLSLPLPYPRYPCPVICWEEICPGGQEALTQLRVPWGALGEYRDQYSRESMEREVSGEKEGCEGFPEEGEIRPQRQGQSGMVTRDTRPTQARGSQGKSQKAEEEGLRMLGRPWWALLRTGTWWGLQRGHAEEVGRGQLRSRHCLA